ncbi:MAG: hypothetical protein ACSLFO_01810, partial [Acidimicrobiales bacterium]
GVAPVAAVECVRPKSATTVTAPAYPFSAEIACAPIADSDRAFATASAITGTNPTEGGVIDGAWLANDRKPMPKVDLHPDRWPLQSTS